MEDNDVSSVESDPNPQTIYRCKKCRRIVATQETIVTHKPKEGEARFRGKRKENSLETNQKPQCSSIFVEPMKWMDSVQDGSVEEKLWCHGCKARRGQFIWAGMQCNCGTCVNPAFQLHKSRLDECTS